MDRETFDISDSETASQLSISLESAPNSPSKVTLPLSPPPAKSPSPQQRFSIPAAATESKATQRDVSQSSDHDPSSASETDSLSPLPTATVYTTHFGTKARPESVIIASPSEPLISGIALVDFNHLVGPRIEWSSGSIFDDEEIASMLPFLALPDGVHLSIEDYSYFHLVPSSQNARTLFGIACTRQVKTSALLHADADATRSTVQKAVVIVSSKPIFGLVRDKLGVVTRALFEQLDFRETDMLKDFAANLEVSLHTQMTESGMYMGTSLRELIHKFRHRTLVLLKALMLQKRIMFFGHPVERLCTYQYSLASLIPGLLLTLEDCGSPPLAQRAPTLSRPTSLRTSDRRSLLAYLGLPLDVFGKDAFFQPYLPLQGLDMMRGTPSWLVGSTNDIVVAAKEVQLVVNTESAALEFRDPRIERMVALTAADRRWMDELVRDVNEGWDDEDHSRPANMQFKGSDDYLRAKFEEYISSALASIRYRDFVKKGEGSGVGIVGGEANSLDDFNLLWVAEFRTTHVYQVWERVTDPMLFDIVEPRHPCNEKPSVVADIGLRLQEGLQDLRLEEQLAPTREAINRTIAVGSTNIYKAFEGVRGWTQQRLPSALPIVPEKGTAPSKDVYSSAPFSVSTHTPRKGSVASVTSVASSFFSAGQPPNPSTTGAPAPKTPSWGTSFGSYFGSKSRYIAKNTGSPSTSASATPASCSPASIKMPLPDPHISSSGSSASRPTPPLMHMSLTEMTKRPGSISNSEGSSDGASELRMQIRDLEGDHGVIDLSEHGVDPYAHDSEDEDHLPSSGLAMLAACSTITQGLDTHDDDAKTPVVGSHLAT